MLTLVHFSRLTTAVSNRSISRARSLAARFKPLITLVSESEAFNLNINGREQHYAQQLFRHGERRARELTRSISTFSRRPSPALYSPPTLPTVSHGTGWYCESSCQTTSVTTTASAVCLYAYFADPPAFSPTSLSPSLFRRSLARSLPALFKYNFVVY